MSTNIINFNTATKSLNDAKFEADVLAKIHESSPSRWWMARRYSDQFETQQFDLIFLRDLGDLLKQSDPEQNRRKMLTPLYQYLKYINVNGEHADALLEGYLFDNLNPLNLYLCPELASTFIAKNPDKSQFITPEFSYESFLFSDLVPIYMVNKFGECEQDKENNIVNCDLYIQLEHTEFIEMIFRPYSIFVEHKEFAKDGFIKTWSSYLALMQQNIISENLENIHRMYWFSFCPELADLTNTTKGVN